MKKNQLYIRFFGLLLSLGLLLSFSQSVEAADGSIRINGGATDTRSRLVTIDIWAPQGATQMIVINDDEDDRNTYWQSITPRRDWFLDFGSGRKKVIVQFRNAEQKVIATVEDEIFLSNPSSMNTIQVELLTNGNQIKNRQVRFRLLPTPGVESFKISNTNNFDNVPYEPMQETVEWVVTPGTGEKTVYIRFRDVNENERTIEKKLFYTEPVGHIPEGSILKGRGDTVYYYGHDGKIHPFFHTLAYQSFFTGFSGIRFVSDTKLFAYDIAEPVCVRSGTWLLKFQNIPRVYAVEPGCTLRAIRSEAEAYILYGANWKRRIAEVNGAYRFFYDVTFETEYDRRDDNDRDGVSQETEREYGTSDADDDTDEDKLSDYEEIFYWFTDPTNPDSDGDGVNDGVEVIRGRVPNGIGALEELPEGSYSYPHGSVVYRWWGDKKYYYTHQDGYIYYLSDNTRQEAFTSNGFQPRFVVSPAYALPFNKRPDWHVLTDQDILRLPQTKRFGTVQIL